MGLAHRAAAQGENEVNQANNPLAPISALNVQDVFAPSLYGVGGTANTLFVRPVVTTSFMIVRATLPIATAPTGDPMRPDPPSGLGDASLFDVFLVPSPLEGLQLGLGPLFVARTATDTALGTGKWQAGGAAVVVATPSPVLLLGALVTYSHSFAGDGQRPTQSFLSPQAFVIAQIGAGYYVRSTPIATFDLVAGNYVVPFGLGVGKVLKAGTTVINAGLEPQITVLHHGVGEPSFQLSATLNFQFPRGS